MRKNDYSRILRLIKECKAVFAASAVLFLMVCSCNFIKDPWTPFQYSTADISGTVYDAVFKKPMPGVNVRISGTSEKAVTGADGSFLIENVRTGKFWLVFTNSLFKTDSERIQVKLTGNDEEYFIKRKEQPPEITSFSFSPVNPLSCDEPLTIRFSAVDSTGGISGFRLSSPAGERMQYRMGASPFSISDSVVFVSDSGGNLMVELTVTGSDGDSTVESLQITLPDNRRPVFSQVRLSQDAFISGIYSFIEVFARDPDGDFSHVVINWGDAGTVQSTDTAGVYWHKYTVSDDTTFQVSILLFDKYGASRDTVIPVRVRFSAPVLDDNLLFVPSQYLSPEDKEVKIGVRVLEIEGWVSEIVWIINQNDPDAFLFSRANYDSLTGVIGDIGNVFVNQFPTDKLKGTNFVQISVSDRYGNRTTVVGSFFMAGRAE